MDPEFRALLEEVLGDPQARLLRVTPDALRATLYERDRRVSPAAPFLKSAERHLLQAYRDELGRLLCRWGTALLFARGVPAFCHFGDGQVPLPNTETLRKDAAHLQRMLARHDLEPDTAAFLAGCTTGDRSLTPSALLAAANRLAPSAKYERTLGTALLFASDDARSGKRMISESLSHVPTGRDGSYSWEALGWIACTAEDLAAGLACYRAAAECDSDRTLPALFWMWTALRTENEVELSRASGVLEDVAEQHEADVEWFAAELRRALRTGAMELSERSRNLAIGARRQAGVTTWRILDAIE
jgi:hypothetical protein